MLHLLNDSRRILKCISCIDSSMSAVCNIHETKDASDINTRGNCGICRTNISHKGQTNISHKGQTNISHK